MSSETKLLMSEKMLLVIAGPIAFLLTIAAWL